MSEKGTLGWSEYIFTAYAMNSGPNKNLVEFAEITLYNKGGKLHLTSVGGYYKSFDAFLRERSSERSNLYEVTPEYLQNLYSEM